MKKPKKTSKQTKVVDDTVKIPKKQGNGILKYSASVDKQGKIARYSFAYINPRLCIADNGRVIGFDNCHGYHHRQEESIEFISYEDITERFEKEWRTVHEKAKKQS
jgi:hypothetical protein